MPPNRGPTWPHTRDTLEAVLGTFQSTERDQPGTTHASIGRYRRSHYQMYSMHYGSACSLLLIRYIISVLSSLRIRSISIDQHEPSQHRNRLFWHFMSSPQLRCSFWPLFSMMQRLSLSHVNERKYFFHHIMSVMIFLEFYNQKLDELWW
jgi:hypothetical protein